MRIRQAESIKELIETFRLNLASLVIHFRQERLESGENIYVQQLSKQAD